jgi:hypothetical protein
MFHFAKLCYDTLQRLDYAQQYGNAFLLLVNRMLIWPEPGNPA